MRALRARSSASWRASRSSGVALVVEDAELVAGHGHALQAEDLHGVGGAGLGNGVALRVEHGTDASVGHAGDERVADT